MEGLSDVLATADLLYGLLPEAFTAARDEHVRTLRRNGSTARAVAVKDLRRPSVAAWLVNALVRHRRDELDQLLEVGRALREAHDHLAPDELRDLNRQRQAVLTMICRQARELAREQGRPVSDQVLHEVEETLRAALADPSAASAVRSGRLVNALRYAGFGDADEAEPTSARSSRQGRTATTVVHATPVPNDLAVRRPAPGHVEPADQVEPADRVESPSRPAAARAAARREAVLAVQAAQDAAQRAEGSALVAEQHRDVVQDRAGIARDRLDRAHGQVAELESLLTAARAAVSTAAAAWAPLHAEADAAGARAEAARGLANSARAILLSARAHLAEVERAEAEQVVHPHRP